MKNKKPLSPKTTKADLRPPIKARAEETEWPFRFIDFSPFYEQAESFLSKNSDKDVRDFLFEFHPLILNVFDRAIINVRESTNCTEDCVCAISRLALRALALEEDAVRRRRPAESSEEMMNAEARLYELGSTENWKPVLIQGNEKHLVFIPPNHTASQLITGWEPIMCLAFPTISESDWQLITSSQCPQAQFLRAVAFSCDFSARCIAVNYPSQTPPHQYTGADVNRLFSEHMALAQEDGMSNSEALKRSAFLTAAFLQGQTMGDILRNSGINTTDTQLGERLKNGNYEPSKQDAQGFSGLIKGILRDPKLAKSINAGEKCLASGEKGGNANAKEIRKNKGGKLLSERKTELESRLRDYMKKGYSKSRACELLAKDLAKKEKDTGGGWSAEYLRKKLSA